MKHVTVMYSAWQHVTMCNNTLECEIVIFRGVERKKTTNIFGSLFNCFATAFPSAAHVHVNELFHALLFRSTSPNLGNLSQLNILAFVLDDK